MSSRPPTPYPGVNEVLALLLSEVRLVLADEFVGVYLYGSLASGDFDPEGSDIDFLVTTRSPLSAATVASLEAMHARLGAGGPQRAHGLEGTYIPHAALRRFDPGSPAAPTINEGRFYLEKHGTEWIIQRRVLREHGVVVAGPPIRHMIDPVAPDEIRYAVYDLLHSWWATFLVDATRMENSSGYQGYAVLTMCRALYALEHGAIVSKPVAARWAQRTLGEPWAGLIDDALLWRHGRQSRRLPDVLAFIRYTLDHSKQYQCLPPTPASQTTY